MEAKVSIIMGSTSDLPIMEKAAEILNGFCIPFELNALSAHPRRSRRWILRVAPTVAVSASSLQALAAQHIYPALLQH